MSTTSQPRIDDPGLLPSGGDEPAATAQTTTQRARTRRRRRHRRRRIYRRAALVVAVLMVPVAWSYVNALRGPGTDSLGARSIEWMRSHHLGGVVDSVERRWYESHQAKVGGAPDAEVALQVATTIAPTPAPTSTRTSVQPPPTTAPAATASAPRTIPTTPVAHAPRSAPLAAPAPLVSPAAPTVADEGVWSPIGPVHAGVAGAYGTLIRPDSVHTSVLDAVVWIDPHVLALRQYPGAKTPGAPWDRPDHVESERQQQLVAAFAGGFRLPDSRGGMILGNTQLAPMRDGAATLTIDANGVPDIGAWGRDVGPGTPGASTPLDSARQNLDLIVDGGAPVPRLVQDPNREWGFTGPANKSAVWRSGAGITADGALVWVGGPGLTIEALAETLARAGAIRGMQLDINHEWVELNTYVTAGDGSVTGTRLLPEMQHSGNRWLTEDTRDFIAVFERPG